MKRRTKGKGSSQFQYFVVDVSHYEYISYLCTYYLYSPCLMFWMREYLLLGQVGGGWALEIFVPCERHQADKWGSWCIKTHIITLLGKLRCIKELIHAVRYSSTPTHHYKTY